MTDDASPLSSTPGRLSSLFDFSLLKYKEKDELVDVIRRCRGLLVARVAGALPHTGRGAKHAWIVST
jgi:hypothetical protein